MEDLTPQHAHVEFRPMFDFGDYSITSSFKDAEYFGVYYSPSGEPASRDAIFDDPSAALDYIFCGPKYGGATNWCVDNETTTEIYDEDDVFLALAKHFDTEADLQILGKRLGLAPGMRHCLVKRVLKRRSKQSGPPS